MGYRIASTFEIFSRAERIESLAAELYRVLGESFTWTPAEAAMLRGLADEEGQHASRIRLLAAQYRNDPRLFRGSRVPIELLDETERAASRLLQEVAGGRWAHDVEGLRGRIAQVEEQCGVCHAHLLADTTDPRVVKFFEELASQDNAHRAFLSARWECQGLRKSA